MQVDQSGNLVTTTGEKLQGWTKDAAGVVDTNSPVGDIVLPVGTLKAPVSYAEHVARPQSELIGRRR